MTRERVLKPVLVVAMAPASSLAYCKLQCNASTKTQESGRIADCLRYAAFSAIGLNPVIKTFVMASYSEESHNNGSQD